MSSNIYKNIKKKDWEAIKVNQNTPRVSQKEVKSEPKGAKREPKVNLKLYKIDIKDKVAKSMEKRGSALRVRLMGWPRCF